jgi:hypothetical protein
MLKPNNNLKSGEDDFPTPTFITAEKAASLQRKICRAIGGDEKKIKKALKILNRFLGNNTPKKNESSEVLINVSDAFRYRLNNIMGDETGRDIFIKAKEFCTSGLRAMGGEPKIFVKDMAGFRSAILDQIKNKQKKDEVLELMNTMLGEEPEQKTEDADYFILDADAFEDTILEILKG